MDLIKEPNPAFSKQLFLQSLYELGKPVQFKILRTGNIYKSKMNGKPNFMVEMEILTDFPDCKVYVLDLIGYPKQDENGNQCRHLSDWPDGRPVHQQQRQLRRDVRCERRRTDDQQDQRDRNHHRREQYRRL